MIRRVNHHYVPQFLLKNFESSPGKIFEHSLLTSHKGVREWTEVSIREHAAVMPHLYTVVEDELEDDRIERWLEKDFETPAAEAVDRVVHDLPLQPKHYHHLARLFAVQDWRTPRAYHKCMQYWETAGPGFLKSVADGLSGLSVHPGQVASIAAQFSRKLTPEIVPLSFKQEAETETRINFDLGLVNGRKLWLWTMQHALRNLGPIQHLYSHRWTILRSGGRMPFLLSDAPAIKLGVDVNQGRNFDGGWGSNGTVLMMPLSPEHLLFTEINRPPIRRDFVLPDHKTEEIRHHVVNHAYRFIYTHQDGKIMERYRARRVDSSLFRKEKDGWLNWHHEHSAAERE